MFMKCIESNNNGENNDVMNNEMVNNEINVIHEEGNNNERIMIRIVI